MSTPSNLQPNKRQLHTATTNPATLLNEIIALVSDDLSGIKRHIEKQIESLRSKKEIKVSKQKFEEAAIIRDKERKLLEALSSAQKSWNEESKDNANEISSEHVADVVSLITGIPVNKVAESESNK